MAWRVALPNNRQEPDQVALKITIFCVNQELPVLEIA